MKATFENIGPIKKAELELGDLTIIAGQNNTGKTYLVYTLYGYFNTVDKKAFRFDICNRFANKTNEFVKQIKVSGQARMHTKDYNELRSWMMSKISSVFSANYLGQIFSSPNGEFEDARFLSMISNADSEKENTVQTYIGESEIIMNHSRKDNEMVFDLVNSKNAHIPDDLIGLLLAMLFWSAVQKFKHKPFILSAERFGISLFYKELDFTKNRLVEELQKLSDEKHFDPFRFLEKESARYAQPIKDNIDFTRDLSTIQKGKSELAADKFRSVVRMMDGSYKVTNDELRFISNRRGENKFDIPLHLASSSARGVSDLYFYLKNVAKEGQLLIIDEPESHLSPTNQILMARLLAFCVNSGLKVLITTHSDYMVKEINNLIMLHGPFEGKEKFLKHHKKVYTESDYLNPKSVRGYVCEEGRLTSCAVNKLGIDMPVFDKAIDQINAISNELGLIKTIKSATND